LPPRPQRPSHQQPHEGQDRLQPSHDVPYGTGVGKIARCLEELKARFGEYLSEYENNWDNSVPDVKQCIDFVRSHPR
jgi:hypothetical protein